MTGSHTTDGFVKALDWKVWLSEFYELDVDRLLTACITPSPEFGDQENARCLEQGAPVTKRLFRTYARDNGPQRREAHSGEAWVTATQWLTQVCAGTRLARLLLLQSQWWRLQLSSRLQVATPPLSNDLLGSYWNGSRLDHAGNGNACCRLLETARSVLNQEYLVAFL